MSENSFNCPKCKSEVIFTDEAAGIITPCPSCNQPIQVPMPDLSPGEHLGDFALLTKVGIGGMGEVWLAEQLSMGRRVALKVLSPELTRNTDFVDRFNQEVKVAGKLSHPNIVTAYHAGMSKGVYYLAMEFVQGIELEQRITKDTIIPEAESLQIIKDVARALKYAWDNHKLLHRDIKPANIMIGKNNKTLLMDMGISKTLTEDSSLTMSGEIVGTPYYMSPEQAKSDHTMDFRADLYSLGASMFHMVTGKVPYDAPAPMGILAKHITSELPDPISVNPNLSKQCSELLKIMMKKEKEERYQSWQNLIDDIERVQAGKYPQSVKTSFSKAAPAVLILTAAALAAVVYLFNIADFGNNNIPYIQPSHDLGAPVENMNTTLATTEAKNAKAIADQEALDKQVALDKKFEFEVQKAVKKAREKEQKAMLEQAERFYSGNPTEYDTAISKLKALSIAEDSKFNEFVQAKIDSIQIDKQKEVDAVIKDLEIKAENVAGKKGGNNLKQLLRAAKLLKKYSDKFVKETEDFRTVRAEYYLNLRTELIKSTKAQKQLEQEKEKKETDETKVVYRRIAEELLRSDFQTALDIFKRSSMSSSQAEVRNYLEQLTSIDEIILKSVKKRIGHRISLKINGIRSDYTIKPTSPEKEGLGQFFLSPASGIAGKITIGIKPAQLDMEDKKNLIVSDMNPISLNIINGVEYIKTSPSKALIYFKETGPFSLYLSELTEEIVQKEFADYLIRIHETLGITRNERKTSIELILSNKEPTKRLEDAIRILRSFKSKFESSTLYEDDKEYITDLEAALFIKLVLNKINLEPDQLGQSTLKHVSKINFSSRQADKILKYLSSIKGTTSKEFYEKNKDLLQVLKNAFYVKKISYSNPRAARVIINNPSLSRDTLIGELTIALGLSSSDLENIARLKNAYNIDQLMPGINQLAKPQKRMEQFIGSEKAQTLMSYIRDNFPQYSRNFKPRKPGQGGGFR